MKAVISRLISLFLLPLFAYADTLMVIDAGSTGTRAYVYETTIDENDDITVTKIIDKKVSPAVTAVTDFNIYFNNLLSSVQTPDAVNADTPVYLYATAGVRMLPQAEQDALMANIRQALNVQAVLLGYPDLSNNIKEDVRVISAAEEAYFIWVNDQYVTGNLDQTSLNNRNTFGAIEMGGASAEIAVLQSYANSLTLPFSYGDKTYHVYSKGYDGSGQDQAVAAMLNAFNTNGGDFAACFPEGAPYPLNAPVLTGTGNFYACTAYIKRNPVNSYRTAPSTNDYLLTGGFYYTFKILGLADDTNPQWVTVNDLKTAGANFCATSWEQLQAEFPAEATNYLVNYCFNSAFQHYYLTSLGLNFADDLMSVDKYNGQSMTWTLGVAYIDKAQ